MNELVVIKVMNDAMIRSMERKGESSIKHLKIKEYLQDEAFFYKISKESAFKILSSVGIRSDQLEITYEKLVNPSTYYRLIKEAKININDKSLVIKF